MSTNDASEEISASAAHGEALVAVAPDERAFGRYWLRYEIASGGMATVYLARIRGPGGFQRPIALKRIHPHLAKKGEFVEMFLDEARLLARITHPNVCSVFDFGEVDGTYFIAMEYLVGQPLSSVLRRLAARPEIRDSRRWHVLAARIVADAAEGLHAAHELRDEAGKPLGVVHRDVSPHNIFVTYDGGVKVVDFGVAWASKGRLHHTQTGTLKGKLAYMAPEQVRREPLDRRVDVWALGVCLWEMLTARRLFSKRNEVETLSAVVQDPIVPPSKVREGVPAALDDIVMRALARNAEQRHATARALARELNAFVSASGLAAGLADLAEIMEELFPREREAKLAAVASLAETGSDIVPADGRAGDVHAEHAGQDAAPTTQTPVAALPKVAPRITPSSASAASAARLDESARPAGRRTWLALGAVVAALTVAGLVSVAAFGGGEEGSERAAAVASSAATAPESSVPTATTGHRAEPAPSSSTVAAQPTPALEAGEPAAGPNLPTGTPAASPRLAPIAGTAPDGRATPPRPGTGSTRPQRPLGRHDPVPREPGTVNVATRGGWADIYVGGRLVGRTPRSIQLPPGRAVLELRPRGELPARRVPVVVESGQTSRVVVDL